MKIKSYKELVVWQKAILLVEAVYKLTNDFPKEEMYGLTSQIRRAVVSIPSNIAEGYGRKSENDYKRFYKISYGSALELDTQILIAKNLGYSESKKYTPAELLLEEICKMLNVMSRRTV